MCGIVGRIAQKAGDDGRWITEAVKSIRHRGPDGFGFSGSDGYTSFGPPADVPSSQAVLLGHVRLSILDLSERGRQPMISADGRHALTYNGEVYNYRELRESLEAEGVRFNGETDTEVVLAMLERFGCAALPRFKGMFAFCWVDLVKREFTLVRDFFGIKPLYYTLHGGAVTFCSEQRPLLNLPGISRKVRPQRIYDFVRMAVPDDGRATFFESIAQVPPAHYLKGPLDDPCRAELVEYWRPDLSRRSSLSFPDAAEQMREMFLTNLKLHLRSDVPLGAALSGGIDSSAIVCGIRKLEPSAELHTFCYAPQGYHYNEENWARMAGDHVGAHQHFVDLQRGDFVRDIDYMLEVQEDPFHGVSHYASNRVFGFAREKGIIVLLNGQGGDEILAGYPMYFGVRLAGAIARREWGLVTKWLLNKKQVGGGYNSGWLMAGAHLLPESLQRLARSLVGRNLAPAYFQRGWLEAHRIRQGRLENPVGKDGLSGYLWDTLNRTCLPSLLHYDDRNSMSHSQESRVPFLTPDFVELALSLPESYLIDDAGVTKRVFREAMRGIVPDPILDRKDKIGFQTPIADFLRQVPEWVESILGSVQGGLGEVFDRKVLLKEWQEVRRSKELRRQDFFRVIVFLRWMQLRQASLE